MGQRILAAVMFTDIVGYSALASRNEEEALRIVEINRNHQKPIIEKYGIYLKEMGDGVLARFSSAYDSIRCAQEIQESCPHQLKDKIRIGLHLGDVSENNGDIFGDGVNVASRLETKAQPGKIYLSDSVYNAIKGRGDVYTKYVGTFKLKNLKDPVRTYTIIGKDEATPTPFLKSKIWKSIRHILIAIAVSLATVELVAFLVSKNDLDQGIVDVATLGVLFALIGYLIYRWLRGTRLKVILVQILNVIIALATMGFYLLNPLDINPSTLRLIKYNDDQRKTGPDNAVVVLPFPNFIGDDQQYLIAGIHDGLINEIGKLGSIRTISRTSTLPYANAEKTLKTIASELDVNMVVEGSLIRIDSVLELHVKLIDPFRNEEVLWSDSYEINLSEIQKLYKEVTRNVALKINEVLLPNEETLLSTSSTQNTAAYQATLMGKYFLGNMTQAGFDKGEEYFQRAITEDSTYAPALSGLALTWGSRKQMGFVSPQVADPKMKEYLERAIQSGNSGAEVWMTKASVMVWTDYDLKGGEQAFMKSIALNPNLSMARAGYAHVLMMLNRWDEAWEQMNYALEIDPLNPIIIAFSGVLYSFQGKYLSATKKFEEITAMVPDHSMANAYLLQKYSRTFQYGKAVVELKKFVESYLPNVDKLVDEVYARDGFKPSVIATAEALEDRAKTTFVPAAKIVRLYESIGDTDNRLQWMEEMYNQKSPGLPYLAIQTGAPIQKDPRYISIMKKAGFW